MATDSIIHTLAAGPETGTTMPVLFIGHDYYLPLLYVLGAQGDGDTVSFFADKVTLGSMSMRSVRVG